MDSLMTVEQKLKDLLIDFQKELGFHKAQWTTLTKPFSIEIYRQWIKDNKHGEMAYLEKHLPLKETPQMQWPLMRSALVFTTPYFPHPRPRDKSPLKEARISLYAQGHDYHQWFRQQLNQIIERLQSEFPQESFFAATDSSPILERDLATRAGLGWVGKNSCLIHPQKGSLFFIGEILTSLDLSSQWEPLPDFCGKCTRCIDACPTQAIEANRTLDARKCIAYWTIESRQNPPENLSSHFGDHFFGCDICQTVCPWNQKIFKTQLQTDISLHRDAQQMANLETEMNYLLASSGKQLERDFQDTALGRAGPFGLRRNALLIIKNLRLKNCKAQVEQYLTHEKLGSLAHETLRALEN